MHAFEITEEDVEAVLKNNWTRAVNTAGHTFTSMASNLLPQLNHAMVEDAALYGDDMDTQTRYAHEEIERQLSLDLGVLEPLAQTVSLSEAWFDLHMSPTPPAIKQAAKSICLAHQIKGISDPMYIANVIASELGAGDGRGHFHQAAGPVVSSGGLDAIAQRLAGSYGSSFQMSAESIRDLLGKAIPYCFPTGADQSRIEKKPEGWTVVNSMGAVKLRLADGAPAYLTAREEVVQQCRLAGLYEVTAGNPAGLSEGVLVEFSSSAAANEPVQGAQAASHHIERPRG